MSNQDLSTAEENAGSGRGFSSIRENSGIQIDTSSNSNLTPSITPMGKKPTPLLGSWAEQGENAFASASRDVEEEAQEEEDIEQPEDLQRQETSGPQKRAGSGSAATRTPADSPPPQQEETTTSSPATPSEWKVHVQAWDGSRSSSKDVALEEVTRFTLPPPPRARLYEKIADEGVNIDAVQKELALRWYAHAHRWLAGNPKDRPAAPCPEPLSADSCDKYLDKVKNWYVANFGERSLNAGKRRTVMQGHQELAQQSSRPHQQHHNHHRNHHHHHHQQQQGFHQQQPHQYGGGGGGGHNNHHHHHHNNRGGRGGGYQQRGGFRGGGGRGGQQPNNYHQGGNFSNQQQQPDLPQYLGGPSIQQQHILQQQALLQQQMMLQQQQQPPPVRQQEGDLPQRGYQTRQNWRSTQ